MTNEQKIENMRKEISSLHDILHQKRSKFDFSNSTSFREFEQMGEWEQKRIAQLDGQIRMMMEPEFKDIPKYGSVMTLESFIDNVKVGNFIDYDGSGNYVRDGKMSNISIHPSDVWAGNIRADFDTIVWFNR